LSAIGVVTLVPVVQLRLKEDSVRVIRDFGPFLSSESLKKDFFLASCNAYQSNGYKQSSQKYNELSTPFLPYKVRDVRS
jgi:hypothetical protein